MYDESPSSAAKSVADLISSIHIIRRRMQWDETELRLRLINGHGPVFIGAIICNHRRRRPFRRLDYSKVVRRESDE
jgi:hypothetical protein